MGYWGHLVVARSTRPLSVLREVTAFGTPQDERPIDHDWRLLRVAGSSPSLRAAVAPLVAATGAPVLAAYVLDSDCAVVEGQTHIGMRWTGVLNRQIAARDYQAPVDDYDSPERAVLGAQEWSRQARLTPSEDLLRQAFTEERDSAEEIFDLLLAGLGIG
ncbi:MAG TPA: hypothetical protein VF160_06500 [Candidatus Dormibacteraeota bacterium]